MVWTWHEDGEKKTQVFAADGTPGDVASEPLPEPAAPPSPAAPEVPVETAPAAPAVGQTNWGLEAKDGGLLLTWEESGKQWAHHYPADGSASEPYCTGDGYEFSTEEAELIASMAESIGRISHQLGSTFLFLYALGCLCWWRKRTSRLVLQRVVGSPRMLIGADASRSVNRFG